MNWKIIFSVLLAMFTFIWLNTISFFRVYDITPDDRLSLLSRVPNYYVLALFVLASLCLIAFYLKESSWSTAFAILFMLYFSVTPWFIEPLRIIDTFFHFSRVPVVMKMGHLPTLQGYYFDYPGSTIFGAMFLSVTVMEPLLFIKYFFPLLSTIIFCLGFLSVVKRMFKSWSPVGPSLLLVSLFGYGGDHFSPSGFAWMIIPFLLLSALPRKGKSFSACFILLTISLAISHPTTSAFLIVILPALMLVLQVGKKIPITMRKLLTLRTLIFITIVLTWSGLITYVFSYNIKSFAQSVFETLFFHPQEIPSEVWQPIYSIFEISLFRRVFATLSGILAAVVLFKSLRIISGNSELTTPRKDWISLSIAFVSVGFLLCPLFFVSNARVFGFYYSFIFGLFGTAMGIGLLNMKSRKSFCVLLLIVLSLVSPAFVTKYPVEHWHIMRDSVRYGLQFTGNYVNGETARILSPLSGQLYSFMDFREWPNVKHILLYGDEMFDQIRASDYFIFRIDGLYYAAIHVEGKPVEQTTYFRLSMALLSNASFDLVYSSSKYQIFARHTLAGQ